MTVRATITWLRGGKIPDDVIAEREIPIPMHISEAGSTSLVAACPHCLNELTREIDNALAMTTPDVTQINIVIWDAK